MEFAGYVFGGWGILTATLVGYWLWILRRTKHAMLSLPEAETSLPDEAGE